MLKIQNMPDLRIETFMWTASEHQQLLISYVDAQQLARLTSLTKLVLTHVDGFEDVSPLSTLPNLQELALMNSRHMETKLFRVGSMQSLRKLIIEDNIFSGMALGGIMPMDDPPPPLSLVRLLKQVGQAILKLPRLVEISGRAKVFDELHASGWWQKSADRRYRSKWHRLCPP